MNEFLKGTLIGIIFLFIGCGKIYIDSDVTTREKLAYLKDDMSLVSGVVRLYDKDRIMMEGNYIDGKKNSYYREWHKNGQMALEANYKDNMVIGMCKRWYENGQIKYKGNYKDGKEHGPHTTYSKNGVLQVKKTFIDGKEINSNLTWIPFDNENIKSYSISQTKEFKEGNFTFNIVWDKQLSHSENLGYYGGIKSMTISKDDKILNVIHKIEDEIGIGEIRLNFYDYNFDGYIDFTVPVGCGKICWEKYYLFNAEINKFEYKKEWDYLRIKRIDNLNKWILSESDGNTTTDNSKTFKIKGLELIEFEVD